ncbi:MAG: DUF3256 family protein [Prevotella sp.]
MRKTLLTLALMVSTLAASAKSMKDLWISMPDSMIPYLTRDMRAELVNAEETKEINNALGGKTRMDTLTHRYLRVTLTEASQIEMRLLPSTQGDSVLCVVQTYKGSLPESVVNLYTQEWEKMDTKQLFDGQSAKCVAQTLVERPDTMTAQQFEELQLLLDPMLIQMALSIDSDEIVFTASAPMLDKKDQMQVNAILMQRKFKWADNSFKKVIN